MSTAISVEVLNGGIVKDFHVNQVRDSRADVFEVFPSLRWSLAGISTILRLMQLCHPAFGSILADLFVPFVFFTFVIG